MKHMSTWAKLELSRELRQWIGLGIKAAGGLALGFAWVEAHPEIKMKLEALKYEAEKKLRK